MADGLDTLVEAEYGPQDVDVDFGIIYLVGDFGQNAIAHLAMSLDHLMREKHDSIVVRISSPGGYASAGVAMYDLMQACPVQVDTEILGNVGSTAVMAYLAGERRLCHAHSVMMIHGTRAEGSGSRAILKSELASMDWYDDRAVDLLSEVTGQPRELWQAMVDDGRNHDLVGSDRLMELGLATEVVQYR
jgi:ATP-dependent Clp protease protease subunit